MSEPLLALDKRVRDPVEEDRRFPIGEEGVHHGAPSHTESTGSENIVHSPPPRDGVILWRRGSCR